jgi:hypothetical protein
MSTSTLQQVERTPSGRGSASTGPVDAARLDKLWPSENDGPSIVERIEDAYEYAVWAADLGMIDFDAFAPLGDVLRELRAEARA